jgi:hypothetical protein
VTKLDWQNLIVASITEPADVARNLVQLGMRRDVLWAALALAAVLNGILIGLSNIVLPGASPFPMIFDNPMVVAGLVFLALAAFITAITWVGQWLGGAGQFEEVMTVLLWLQALRLMMQAITLLLVLIVPLLSALFAFAAGIVALYILVHFINVAHKLESIGKAIVVIVASAIVMVLSLSLLLSLFGGPILETASRV